MKNGGGPARSGQEITPQMFAAVTGLSLGSYIRRRRITKAVEKLRSSSERIIEIAMDAGFESQESFTRAFKTMLGVNPNEYRKSESDFGVRKLEAITENLINQEFEIMKVDKQSVV